MELTILGADMMDGPQGPQSNRGTSLTLQEGDKGGK